MSDEIIKNAVEVLKAGGIMLYPTDTLIGLGCDAMNDLAVQKIFEMKGRDSSKPMSIACSNVEMVKQYANLSEAEEQVLTDLLPGPYTFILEKKDNLSDTITGGIGSVGVRIPDYPILLEIIQNLGRPIITTSANQSGEPDIKFLKECKYRADFVLDTDYNFTGPSTVVDLKNKLILREGIGSEKIKGYLNRQ